MKRGWLYFFGGLELMLVCGGCEPSGPHRELPPTMRSNAKVSYQGDIKPIFANFCSACHPSRSGPDWLDYKQAKIYALNGKLVQRAVTEKSMPPPGSPQAASITDSVRGILADWAQSGASLEAPAQGENQNQEPPSAPLDRGFGSVQACMQCHGGAASTSEMQPKIPRLAGQNTDYLVDQLLHFKWRERLDPSNSMNEIAAELSEEKIVEVANYFSRAAGRMNLQTLSKPPEQNALYIRGRSRALMDCNACHMNAERSGNATDGHVPLLAGQSKQYLINQLLSFRENSRPSPLMHEFARTLTNEALLELAIYFALSR